MGRYRDKRKIFSRRPPLEAWDKEKVLFERASSLEAWKIPRFDAWQKLKLGNLKAPESGVNPVYKSTGPLRWGGRRKSPSTKKGFFSRGLFFRGLEGSPGEEARPAKKFQERNLFYGIYGRNCN